MRLNEDVLAIGFDNGAFVKIVEPGCFEERGLTQETCVLRAHEAPKEVQDIFKRVAGGKLLGPHVSRKANCRAQVIFEGFRGSVFWLAGVSRRQLFRHEGSV